MIEGPVNHLGLLSHASPLTDLCLQSKNNFSAYQFDH